MTLAALRDFGDYELLEEIARGGMGIVYRARQKSLDRIVVVKLLLSGSHADDESVRRFKVEATAAGSLHHPNIVAIHEVGLHDGQHFLVMDFVDGPNLAKLVRDQPLPAMRAAAYMQSIAEAIHSAHERNILHRDLKPSNVLIDSNDRPRVTDFGLARRLDGDSSLTLSGQVLGSPNYMPPEQAAALHQKVSRRSDVYGLGAIFYHLLTGRPPFQGATISDTVHQVLNSEPASPRVVNPDVPLDLETVCLKCLEKEPGRRYATACELGGELGRFLAGEPVLTRPVGQTERLWRWCRRKPVVAGLSAALLGLLVSVAVGATVFAFHLERQNVKLRQAQADVIAQRDAKEKARQEAESISTYLTAVFQSPDPARDGRTITVAEILDQTARKLDLNLTNQPARRARLQATLGQTYHALGLDRDALPLLEQVWNYNLATLGPEHPETLGAMGNVALSNHEVGRLNEAIKLGEEALVLHRKVNGPEHSKTINAMNNLALSYHDDGRRDEALKMQEQVLLLSRRVNGPEQPETLRAMINLASSYGHVGRRDEALKLKEDVLPLSRRVNGPEHPSTLVAMYNLASSYFEIGRWDEALKQFEEVLALIRKVHGPEHPRLLGAMGHLANCYAAAGRRDEALKLREDLLPLSRKVNGSDHAHTLETMDNVAISYLTRRSYAQAEPLLIELLAHARRYGATNPSELELRLGDLAELRYRQQQYAFAEPLYRERLQSRRNRAGGETSEVVASVPASLGRLFSDWAWAERGTNGPAAFERARHGETLIREAIAAYLRRTNTPAGQLAEVQSRLGGALCVIAFTDPTLTSATREPKLTAAEALLLQGHAGLEKDRKAESKYKRDALDRLVRLYEAWPRPDQAVEWKHKLEAFDQAEGEEKPRRTGEKR